MRINGWNRIFIVVAVLWTIVAPFIMVAAANESPLSVYRMCSDRAYHLYGSSSSPRLDMDRYHHETDVCSADLQRGLTDIPMLLKAMIGVGDWRLGAIAWGTLMIPLAVLWLVCWAIGRTVIWVAAGFRSREAS